MKLSPKKGLLLAKFLQGNRVNIIQRIQGYSDFMLSTFFQYPLCGNLNILKFPPELYALLSLFLGLILSLTAPLGEVDQMLMTRLHSCPSWLCFVCGSFTKNRLTISHRPPCKPAVSATDALLQEKCAETLQPHNSSSHSPRRLTACI